MKRPWPAPNPIQHRFERAAVYRRREQEASAPPREHGALRRLRPRALAALTLAVYAYLSTLEMLAYGQRVMGISDARPAQVAAIAAVVAALFALTRNAIGYFAGANLGLLIVFLAAYTGDAFTPPAAYFAIMLPLAVLMCAADWSTRP
jgi:hypothetical protein